MRMNTISISTISIYTDGRYTDSNTPRNVNPGFGELDRKNL